MAGREVRRVDFASAEAKAKWIDAKASIDAWRCPLVRDIARRFAQAPCYDPNDLEPLARDLFEFVRDAIKYIKDPLVEELSDSQQVLEQGFGDCDDKARLYVALCRSVGITARIRPVFDGPESFVHVQAEVYLPRKGWRVCDLIVRDLPLGSLPTRGALLV
jgi:transglutaminase-like putative cysteine protease